MGNRRRQDIDEVAARPSGRARLDPDMSAGRAFLDLQTELLATLRRNEEGIRADRDAESLHDFRVALRRSRVLHRLFREQLEGSGFEAMRSGFRRLARVTGPTRDLDVHLDSLRSPKRDASETEALEPLLSLLQERRTKEWSKLEAALSSSEYGDFMTQAERLLSSPDSEAAQRIAGSGPPLRPWVTRRIAKADQRLRRHGREIDRGSPDSNLHAVRIDAKNLRYLLEFFSGLYPARAMRKLIRELDRLQDNLGHFNDACVQRGTLRALARDLEQQGRGSVETLLGVGRLLERAEKRRSKERNRFEERWTRFERPAMRRRFRRLFGR